MKSIDVYWRSSDKTKYEDIINTQLKFGISFPKEYLEIIEKKDSAKAMYKGDKGVLRSVLVDISKWSSKKAGISNLRISKDESGIGMVIHVYDCFKECLPDPNKMFPFADDGGGNIFFFDYRKNEEEPAILFLDHEEAYSRDEIFEEDLNGWTIDGLLESAFYPVADSFSEFVSKFRKRNEDEL